jgi:hypothetical protein
VQHLNDLKAVMEKDLKVAQLVPHTPIQDHDFGGSIRSVSTRSVRSNSGGELYNTYSNESNHYKVILSLGYSVISVAFYYLCVIFLYLCLIGCSLCFTYRG